MLNNNYGYACLNMQLAYPEKFSKNKNQKIFCNRSMVKKTFLDKGISYAADLAIQNCFDLFKIIKWNKNNDFNFFRVSSDMFPWCSEYKLSQLKNYKEIRDVLNEIGNYVYKHNMRLTSHPGPFNVLTSPHSRVVKNCVHDLSVQGEVFDLMNLTETPFNKINIHIGGAYGDKIESMKRFCKNFELLPSSVKKRLTVENDDRASMYSVKDLYNGVYKSIGIPIVFDYHHHKFCDGNMNEEEALKLSVSTWGNITPVIHYSESRSLEKNDESIKPHAHSDYVYDFINTYNHKLDVMIEAKHKELAVLKYLETNKKMAV